jgi:hypothetical protein
MRGEGHHGRSFDGDRQRAQRAPFDAVGPRRRGRWRTDASSDAAGRSIAMVEFDTRPTGGCGRLRSLWAAPGAADVCHSSAWRPQGHRSTSSLVLEVQPALSVVGAPHLARGWVVLRPSRGVRRPVGLALALNARFREDPTAPDVPAMVLTAAIAVEIGTLFAPRILARRQRVTQRDQTQTAVPARDSGIPRLHDFVCALALGILAPEDSLQAAWSRSHRCHSAPRP